MPWKAKVESQVGRLGSWGTAIGIVWGGMTWAAAYITPYSNLGWGTFVFLGFGAACALTLVLSAAFTAWRYFSPLAPHTANRASDASNNPTELDGLRVDLKKLAAEQISTGQGLSNMIGGVEDKLEQAVKALEARVVTLQTMLEQHKSHVALEHQEINQSQMRLRNAILARDAVQLMKMHDDAIVELGNRLLEPDGPSYRDADSLTKAWLADYDSWKRELAEADRVARFYFPNHKRYLDISAEDFERNPALPPASIASDPANVTRFKTLHIVMPRYMQQRAGIKNHITDQVREPI